MRHSVAVEDDGLDGLWLPDHTHIPVSRHSPYPLGGIGQAAEAAE